jgi:hypothetical protein
LAAGEACGDEDAGRELQPLEFRKSLGKVVFESVVKGDHRRRLSQFAGPQPLHGLCKRQHLVMLPDQLQLPAKQGALHEAVVRDLKRLIYDNVKHEDTQG